MAFALMVYRESGAQPSNILRLRGMKQELQAKKDFQRDTAYIDVLDSLAYGYYRINADSVFFYSNQALAYSKKAGYGRGESVSLRQLGNGYKLAGDYTNMLSCYRQALAIAEKINNPTCIAKASINIAMFDTDMGKYDEALALLETAGRIFGETKDSLDLNKTLTAIAASWLAQKQYDQALQYYQQALRIAIAMKNDYLMITNKDEMGEVLFVKGRYKEALANYLRSLDYFSHTDDKMRQSKTAAYAARAYFYLKDYQKALKYALQSLELAKEIKTKAEIKDADKILEDIYKAKGDYRNALTYSQLYKGFSDSLFNEEMRKKTEKLEARYEFEKKESQLKEEQAKKDALHQQFVQKNEWEISIAALLILFLSALTLVLFRSRAAKQKTNQILEAKNEKIEHQAVLLLLNNQEKDKLFSIIAHDLRGPLHSLKEVLDFLKENSLPEAEINKIMDELRRDVNYSAELVNNLLFWACSQLDGMVASPAVLSVHQLVSNTVNLFVKQAADKKISLKNELDPALCGYADKDMIQVLIRNLVSNAVKFCRPGDSIIIQGKTTGGAIEICVADTGIGIGKDILKKINLKEKVTTLGTADEKGTGLGMLLCREFAEANKGLFRVESEEGKGSRFYFTIPAIPGS
ncbi:MAG TPA: tetratricopeptide repeat-containing sensor histidine kinase [Puia sp.]|nr:tetratricopeptide repeat-containing sensor histidine kinase [Puia sp.]